MPVDCSLSGSSVHGISQQGYWSGLPFPPPGHPPNPGIDWIRISSFSSIGRQILYHWATWKAWYKQDQAYLPKLVLGISLEISLCVCVPGVGWGVVVVKAVGGDYWTVSSLKPTDGTEVLAKVRRCRSKSWCSLVTLSPNCSCFPCSVRFRGFTTQQVYNWQISLALPDLNNRLKCGLAGIMKITTSWLINITELPLENRTGMCIWVLAFGV